MPDFFNSALANGSVHPTEVALRLVASLIAGFLVAAVYRWTRRNTETPSSFPATLVFLSVLIAMVTQVIGDNVARAFSLVGALSIVRFRTVVRDTQDTAYVIFAVVVGMAIGAKNLWVAGLGLGVVTSAAFLLRPGVFSRTYVPDYLVNVRVGLHRDFESILAPVLDAHLCHREVCSVGTAKQGLAIEVSYRGRIRPESGPGDLVTALNQVEGVQSARVELRPEQEF